MIRGAQRRSRATWGPSAALWLGLAFAAGWLSGCADDDGSSVHASLHGIVRDAKSGKRLSGVEVVFVADTLEMASDTTDGSGSYAIDVSAATPSGRLTASKSGYGTSTVSAYLDDPDVAIDIMLTPK